MKMYRVPSVPTNDWETNMCGVYEIMTVFLLQTSMTRRTQISAQILPFSMMLYNL